jgi:hypothetical protein
MLFTTEGEKYTKSFLGALRAVPRSLTFSNIARVKNAKFPTIPPESLTAHARLHELRKFRHHSFRRHRFKPHA